MKTNSGDERSLGSTPTSVWPSPRACLRRTTGDQASHRRVPLERKPAPWLLLQSRTTKRDPQVVNVERTADCQHQQREKGSSLPAIAVPRSGTPNPTAVVTTTSGSRFRSTTRRRFKGASQFPFRRSRIPDMRTARRARAMVVLTRPKSGTGCGGYPGGSPASRERHTRALVAAQDLTLLVGPRLECALRVPGPTHRGTRSHFVCCSWRRRGII